MVQTASEPTLNPSRTLTKTNFLPTLRGVELLAEKGPEAVPTQHNKRSASSVEWLPESPELLGICNPKVSKQIQMEKQRDEDCRARACNRGAGQRPCTSLVVVLGFFVVPKKIFLANLFLTNYWENRMGGFRKGGFQITDLSSNPTSQ